MKQFTLLGRRILLILGIIATLFVLLPVLSYDDLQYTGYEIIFGMELFDVNPFDLGTIASARLPFSFISLLAFSLPLIAGIIAFASKRALILSLTFFIVSIFLLIIVPNNIVIVYTAFGSESTESVDWTMMIGLIGAIITTGLAAIINVILILKP
jgi:hypothetical protein